MGNLGLTTDKAIVAGISIGQRECYEIFSMWKIVLLIKQYKHD